MIMMRARCAPPMLARIGITWCQATERPKPSTGESARPVVMLTRGMKAATEATVWMANEARKKPMSTGLPWVELAP